MTEKSQENETKNNRNFGKKTGLFCIVFQMCKAREISNFQEDQTKFCHHYSLEKAGPVMFSFWGNDVCKELFHICGLMHYQKSGCQSG